MWVKKHSDAERQTMFFFKVDIKSSDSLKRAGLGIASAAVSSKVPGSSDIFRYI